MAQAEYEVTALPEGALGGERRLSTLHHLDAALIAAMGEGDLVIFCRQPTSPITRIGAARWPAIWPANALLPASMW